MWHALSLVTDLWVCVWHVLLLITMEWDVACIVTGRAGHDVDAGAAHGQGGRERGCAEVATVCTGLLWQGR